MDYIERGLYRELLDECWSKGSIPDDIKSLAEICDCPVEVMANAWQKLSKCFIEVDGCLINDKLDTLRTASDAKRVKLANAGKKGGLAKLQANDSKGKSSKSKANAKQMPYSTSTSTSTSKAEIPPVSPLKQKREKRPIVGIQSFLDACRVAGEKPILETDPIFNYATQSGIPLDFLRLAWYEFLEIHRTSPKRYADWRAAFRNCVRGNWYKLWWINGDDYQLTTTGMQAQKNHREKIA